MNYGTYHIELTYSASVFRRLNSVGGERGKGKGERKSKDSGLRSKDVELGTWNLELGT
jgi:hypothetical protein